MTTSDGQPAPRLTGTTHGLPFLSLSPGDFELLCYWTVVAEGFDNVQHLGEAGSEFGRDVMAHKILADGSDQLWYFQCKRVARANSTPWIESLDSMARHADMFPGQKPDVVAFVTSALLSDAVRTRLIDYTRHVLGQVVDINFWAKTELDELVNRHPRVLKKFFQIEAGESNSELSFTLADLRAFGLGCSVGNRIAMVPGPTADSVDKALLEFVEMLEEGSHAGPKAKMLMNLVAKVRSGGIEGKANAEPAVVQVYMALMEQLEVELRSDLSGRQHQLFDLGCLLYELAMGRMLMSRDMGEPVLGYGGPSSPRFETEDPEFLEIPRLKQFIGLVSSKKQFLPTWLTNDLLRWSRDLAGSQDPTGIWFEANVLTSTVHDYLRRQLSTEP